MSRHAGVVEGRPGRGSQPAVVFEDADARHFPMRASVFHDCLRNHREKWRARLVELLRDGSPMCGSAMSIVADYLVASQTEFIRSVLPSEPAAAGWSFNRRDGRLTLSRCTPESDRHWVVNNVAQLGDIPKLIEQLRCNDVKESRGARGRGRLAHELECLLKFQLSTEPKRIAGSNI